MSGFFVPHDLKAPLKGAATGPLAGSSAVVKDMYAIAGERTGGGNPDWLANATPATAHCTVVEKLLAAGATITGKTICDEFFYSVAGMNAHYGTPTNIRAPGRIPGGSSSGSAAAAAAGVCDFALGSDTGGSVRIPASLCGLYGIRTTHGRIDTKGVMDMSPSFDTIGWLAATAGVFRKVGPGAARRRQRWPAPIQNLLIADDGFAEADAPVAALLNDALAAMAGALPKPQHVQIAPDGLDPWRDAVRDHPGLRDLAGLRPLRRRETSALRPGRRRAHAGRLEDHARPRPTPRARSTPPRANTSARMIKPGTVVALPSAPCIAPRIDTPAAEMDSYRTRVMRLTCIAGLGGLPQVSIPAGTVAGCPVGLSFIGWAGGDEALLDLAVTLSKFCGIERA